MAMTKEELVDLIDCTINTNGEKAITGQALNLALKEIVEAMGSGGGGGSSMTFNIPTSTIYGSHYGDLTEEQIAENVELYNAIMAAKDTPASISIYSKVAIDGEGVFWGQCPYWTAGEADVDGETMRMVYIIAGVFGQEFIPFQLTADGSVSMVDTNALSLSKFKL